MAQHRTNAAQFAPGVVFNFTSPRMIAAHQLSANGQPAVLVSRFLSRFGTTEWFVDDLTRADEDPCGLGVTVHQGDLAGARLAIRRLLGRAA